MYTVNEIKDKLNACPDELLMEEISKWQDDERSGVKTAIKSAQKRFERYEKEQIRLQEILNYETIWNKKGYALVAGVDEVGRGPLAGPVMAAAVVLPVGHKILGVNDSKKLTAKKREELYDVICQEALAFGFGSVSPKRIDEINILQATFEAMKMAINNLNPQPDFILADAVTIPRLSIPQQSIVKGDAKSMSIAAASVIAKVERDRFMTEMDKLYPQYGFAQHKGYGTQAHIDAINEHGICPIHRLSFVKNIVGNANHNRKKGNLGEDIAVKQMIRLGYSIITRNYNANGGEIDIIAFKDGYTVFTEVKYRKSDKNGLPCEAVTLNKQRHIINAATDYIAANSLVGDFRFDVAEIKEEDGRKYFHYIENAFEV